MPFEESAERAVLGCMMLAHADSLRLLQEKRVCSAWFYDQRYAELYRMLELAPAIDAVAVLLEARKHPTFARWEEWALQQFLNDLMNEPVSVHNLELYITELHHAYVKRCAIEFGAKLQKDAQEQTLDPEDFGDYAEATGYAIKQMISAKRPALAVRRPDELLEMSFSEDDVILGDRLLARGQSLTILGAGGIGKSRLLLQLAVCCIAGRDFLGLPTRAPQLKWMILQTENTNRRLQQDLMRLKAFAGDDWAKVNEQLVIRTLEGRAGQMLTLDDPESCALVARGIDEHRPDVVCFDPLNTFGIGDLNKDADMRLTVLKITELAQKENPDRAIVVLHHALTGKAGAVRATGYDRASFGRNSKVLQAWTRGQINIASGSSDDPGLLVMSCGKCSNGREFSPIGIRLHEETMTYSVEPQFDLTAWQTELGGKPATTPVSLETVARCCQGAMPKKRLTRAIMDETGCSRSMAYKQVQAAEKQRLIGLNPVSGHYSAR